MLGIYSDQHVYIARVAESVDAPGLGSGARKGVGVQLPPLAPEGSGDRSGEDPFVAVGAHD